jgi:hypothetical protein
MWIKVNYPEVFYAACLNNLPKKKHLELLQDAERHGVRANPPSPTLLCTDWQPVDGAVVAGLEQIPGIAGKTAGVIIDSFPDGVQSWSDLTAVKGIGAKTIEKIEEFVSKEDPFDIHKLERQIQDVKSMLPKLMIPMPSHTSAQVPFSKGDDTHIVWVGVLKYRNQRNLFEAHFSRTGEELDPATVKNPELAEWVSGMGSDGEEVITLVWDRWKYRRFKDSIFDISLDKDIIVVEGMKKGFQARRAVYVTKMWVFDPEG